MLSDDALAHMSREGLVEQLHKLQEALIATSNNNAAVEDRGARPWQQAQLQRLNRRRKSSVCTVDSRFASESVTSISGGGRRALQVRRGSDETNGPQANRASGTSLEDGSSPNAIMGETTSSLLSLLSEVCATQTTSLPDALPVGNTITLPGQTKPHGASISLSASSVQMRAPARMTDKASLVRNEEGAKCINNYQIIKELGRGTCGKVQLAYDLNNDTLVAIKQVKRVDQKPRIGGQTNAQMQFFALQREIAVMKKLRHKNIVALYEVIDDPNAKKLYLVMMYIDKGPIARIVCGPNGDLDEQVCTPIPKNELTDYARQILSGLDYLHRNKIVHRDIKPENILVDRNKHIFLADFGVSEVFDTTREKLEAMMQESMSCSRTFGVGQGSQGMPIQGTKGTMLFIAPELWRGDRSFAKPVDMWALGVTFYILLTGKMPFRSLDDIMDPTLPEIPTDYGKKWAELLRGMLNRDPNKRMTAPEARALVKSMTEDLSVEQKDEELLAMNISDVEVAHALTLAQNQQDQNDVEWLLGYHSMDYFPAEDSQTSPKKANVEENGDCCLPSVMLNAGASGQPNVVVDSVKEPDKTSDSLRRIDTTAFTRVWSPNSARDNDVISQKSTAPIPKANDLGKKGFLPPLENPSGRARPPTPAGSNSPQPNMTLQASVKEKNVTGHKSKSGLFSSLRKALKFSKTFRLQGKKMNEDKKP